MSFGWLLVLNSAIGFIALFITTKLALKDIEKRYGKEILHGVDESSDKYFNEAYQVKYGTKKKMAFAWCASAIVTCILWEIILPPVLYHLWYEPAKELYKFRNGRE